MTTLYLDKLVTEPHVPKRKGQIGFYSTENIPDLSHTGCTTFYHPQPMTAYDQKKMTIRKSYREKANDKIKVLHREMIAANTIETTFNKGHKQFIDKLLVEMDIEKRAKLKKTQASWKSEKTQIGFASTEFQFFPPDSPAVASSSSATKNDDSLAYSAERGGWGDESFLEQPPLEQQGDEAKDPATNVTIVLPDIHNNTKPSSFSSSCSVVSRASSRGSKSTRSSFRASEPSKVRVFNRMSLFTALLNETPVPVSTLGTRFGTAPSPTRPTR
jgi:hypothetical protein